MRKIPRKYDTSFTKKKMTLFITSLQEDVQQLPPFLCGGALVLLDQWQMAEMALWHFQGSAHLEDICSCFLSSISCHINKPRLACWIFGRPLVQFVHPQTNSHIRKTILKSARPQVAHKLTSDTWLFPNRSTQTSSGQQTTALNLRFMINNKWLWF